MNEQKKQKLLEQYDDAAFALLMDEYAEEEGARLMAEFEAAQAAGQVPQMPPELDEQCRRMIRRDRAKKRGKQAVRSFRKVAVKAAVAVLVFIGLMTTVVMSVDALRVPVLNFILTLHDDFSSFNNGDEYQSTPSTDPLAVLLPDEYVQIYHNVSSQGYIASTYETPEGATFELMSFAYDSSGVFDTANSTYSTIFLTSVEAHLFEGNDLQVLWTSLDGSTIYHVKATDMDKEVFIQICCDLVSNFEFG